MYEGTLKMCDYLLESAKAYADLISKKYHIKLGHRGKMTELTITFPASGYHHLAGLHYLGINALNNRKEALYKILAGEVNIHHIAEEKYNLVESRLRSIIQLKDIICNSREVYRYKGFECVWSNIRADYAIEKDNGDGSTFVFLIGDNGVDLAPTSIFEAEAGKYTQYCPARRILEITKEDLDTGITVNVFTSPSYRH